MIRLTREDFEQIVEQAYVSLPDKFRDMVENVAVIVEDVPGPEGGRFEGKHLLGLYVGTPLTHLPPGAFHYPPKIYLYQENIQIICDTPQEIEKQIRQTLLHEIGHHFGMTEAQLEEIEREHWENFHRRKRRRWIS